MFTITIITCSLLYLGFGILFTLQLMKERGIPNRSTRLFSLIFWPILGLSFVLLPDGEKH